MHRLVQIQQESDIPSQYRDTPIGRLFEYHNLHRRYDEYNHAQMLVGMCMDNRKYLHIPDNFAFIIRSGGANLRYSEFKISFAIAVGGVRYFALIGHNHCGMVNLFSQKEKFVNGLVHGAGWDQQQATDHFTQFAPMFEIGNEIDFVLSETKRLRLRYPKIHIAPLFYDVDVNTLSLLDED